MSYITKKNQTTNTWNNPWNYTLKYKKPQNLSIRPHI